MYTLHLAKELFKFSCSHFTIFSNHKAERLHGHNYQVKVDVTLSQTDPQIGMAFDFNSVKPLIRQICDEMDERILLPARSPFLQLDADTQDMRVTFANKKYSFPLEDTLCLPILNVTSEELARHICEQLTLTMNTLPHWTALRVYVEETRGQGVSYTVTR